MDKVQQLWSEHTGARFPKGLGGAEVDGIDLVMLDADIAGCVDTFLKNHGNLDDKRRAILEVCYQEVSKVALGLAGEPRRYFERLRDVARETLSYLQARGRGGLTSA